MDERPKLPNYDPDYCLKVAKSAASVCVGITIVELLVLLFVDPGTGRCPGWTIYAQNGPATSLWALAGMFTVLPTIWIGYVVLRWEQKFSQKMYDATAYRRPMFPHLGFGRKPKPDPQELNFEQIFLLDANRLFLRVNIGWCLFCTSPLWLLLWNCTTFPRFLGYPTN
jgi:hypothetical protein